MDTSEQTPPMRAQTSVTLITFLLGSIVAGLCPVGSLSGLKQVFQSLLTHSDQQGLYFAHRGSGRIEEQFSPFTTQNLA